MLVVDHLGELEVHLLLADLIMPGMNGIELADHIKKIRPGLPVVYFSAYPDQPILRPILARGIPYIAKPFTSLQLTSKIREMLDTGKSDAADAGSP